MYNFGDDLLLIATLEYMNKVIDFSDEGIEIYIDKNNDSLKDLKYNAPFKLKNACGIDYVFQNERLIINRYKILGFIKKPILFISLIWFLLNIIIYKVFKHAFAYHKFINFTKQLDIIYFIGGGYIAGKWKRRLITEAITVNISKWINPSIKIIGTGMGIGPFTNEKNYFLLKFLKKFDYIFTREKKSFELVKNSGIPLTTDMLGDDVLLLLPLLNKLKYRNNLKKK